MDGQSLEIDPVPRVLTLGGNLIFANRTLFAQNEDLPLSPEQFNPDPGASQRVEPEVPPELFPPVLPQLPEYGEEPLPRSLELPRKGVREVVPRRKKLGYETYPLSEQGEGLLPASQPEPNRWFIGFGRWKRYADPSTETTYQSELRLWHPYLQSKFKGDAPIFGQDIFLNITAEDFFQFEARKLPTPSGVSAERPNSSEFFGRGDQLFYANDFSIGLDLFKGETAFKPVEWALRILGVYNHNYLEVEERNVVNPNPQQGTTREKEFFSLQEAFGEIHLRDLSSNYDFISLRAGIQPFVSDFRGFIFNDTNLGVRIFGNYDNNRWQYNIAAFDMLEKDTYSDLNEFSRRRAADLRSQCLPAGFDLERLHRRTQFPGKFRQLQSALRQEWFHYATSADRHSRRPLRASVLPWLDRRWTHRLAEHRPCLLSGFRRRGSKRNRRQAR